MEFAGVFVFAQFGEGFRLDLADTLTGDTELLADFFEGVLFAVFEADARARTTALLAASRGGGA